ncbi:hypothetical protein ACQEVB_16750 [Pseudonocardia sp. CA-107938]|uniref:hypothetical protein n=1 Tax=Pseudonocardia sp. CA-107938 TaxID=3240021 RepID=UPI003D8AAB4A
MALRGAQPSDDPELDGIVRLAAHVGGSPAFVALGARSAPGPRTWLLRGLDGEVRGSLTVGAGALDATRRAGLDLVAAQAGALLERRDREERMLDVIDVLQHGDDQLTTVVDRVGTELEGELAAVHGHLSLASGPLRGEAPAAACVSAALGAIDRMRHLVVELLGSAAADLPPSTDLRALVAETLGHDPDYAGPERVGGDPDALRDLVRALLGSSPDGRVRAGLRGGGGWWIEVAPADGAEPDACVRAAEAAGGVLDLAEQPDGTTAVRVTFPPG